MANQLANQLANRLANQLAKKSVLFAGTTTMLLMGAQVAEAGQLHQGWNYSIDAAGDGSGGATFDIKGIAIKETADDIYVAISANFPLAGIADSNATGQNVGWGDLFFDFGSGTFNDANANSSLFAVNFATGTDSAAAQIGVYGGVTAKSVGLQNSGYSTLKNYYKAGHEKENTFGGDFSTKESIYQYYAGNNTGESTLINNVIGSGTRLGDINFVNEQAAAAAGLDFDSFNAVGQEQIAFKFDRDLLPSHSFIAHLLLECANDGVAISGDFAKDVPEPGAIAGLALFGLLATRLRRRS